MTTYFTWTLLAFGKHEGKTLPQIILHDPDWFYWARRKNGIFTSALAEQASDIADKASRIKIPKPDPENWRIRYEFHPSGGFQDVRIVPVKDVYHAQGGLLFHESLDLFMPRLAKAYDKLGYRLLLAKVKQHWFNGEKLTKARCERFFLDDANFVFPSAVIHPIKNDAA